MKTRNVLLIAIFLLCAGIMYLPSSKTKVPPQSDKQPDRTAPTLPPPIIAEYLGDRIQSVRYFEHYFDITDWRHVTSNDRDRAIGVSDNQRVVIEFRGDPVHLAKLAVSLDGDSKEGAKIIVEFLSQFLDDIQYDEAVKLLDKGGELKFTNRRILIYRDMEIRKAIVEIEWRGKRND